MNYHFSKTLNTSLEEAISQVKQALKQEGFGVLTEIDVSGTFQKHGLALHEYKIIGACHPSLAYRAIQAEDKAGVFFPCNVVVQQRENGCVEVSAANPESMFQAIDNQDVRQMAQDASQKMQMVIEHHLQRTALIPT